MVTRMTKAQVIQALKDRGVEGWKSEDTVVELKAILREALKRSSPPKAEFMKGITRKSLAELQALYTKIGLGSPRKLTRGLLINKIKHAVLDKPATAARAMFASKRRLILMRVVWSLWWATTVVKPDGQVAEEKLEICEEHAIGVKDEENASMHVVKSRASKERQ